MSHSLAIPGAIIIAGALIAGAFLISSGERGSTAHESPETAVDVRAPQAGDHRKGSESARVTIIEYSDFECPFCARFHPTLAQLVEERDDVAWIFRHFPLTSIHSRARDASIAAECAARLGGNDVFWAYADDLFATQRELGDSLYTSLAQKHGLDAQAFSACRADDDVAAIVDRDAKEAVATGGRGTPHSLLVTARGDMVPFSGALPYNDVKRLVEQALAN